MSLKFYNTMSQKVEEFKSINPAEVKMYTCGPTVYNYAHIGNFRAYIFEDLLRRYLKYKGYKVIQVMNLTDVDDKTIKGSKEANISLSEYTQKYKKAFFEDIEKLNIEKAEYYPEATAHIKEMVELIKKLIEKGYTYESKGSIYYRIKKFKDYGKLSHIDLSNLIDGARIDSDEYEKEEAKDFVLWKAWSPDDGDVYWETEIGKGRPGWHIECSAMSMKYLGETFDIHTGGVDNIFPHHENEIAQAEAATGKKFVNYWLHCAHLIVNGKKMSKSLGNFYTLRDLLEMGYDPIAIRYLLISTHYRQRLNFTFDGIKAAENTIQRIKDFIHNLDMIEKGDTLHIEIQKAVDNMLGEFEEQMDDDLNISGALGKVFEFIKELNPKVVNGSITKKEAEYIKNTIFKIDRVIGILKTDKKEQNSELAENLINFLIEIRQNARKEKNWALADLIRERLKKMGIVLEDRPDKTTFKFI